MSFFVPIEFNVCIPTVIFGFYVIEKFIVYFQFIAQFF